jgi:hypothetical protein
MGVERLKEIRSCSSDKGQVTPSDYDGILPQALQAGTHTKNSPSAEQVLCFFPLFKGMQAAGSHRMIIRYFLVKATAEAR